MQLSLTDVKIGKPSLPKKWNNEKQKDEELDPMRIFLARLEDRKQDWINKSYSKTLTFRETTIGLGAHVYHKNMLEYMEACWRDHLGVTITPDMFWYTLLCELTTIIKDDAEQYRYLFSTSNEKQEIIVLTDDPVRMPLKDLLDVLKGCVPTDVDLFIPKFTTSTHRSEHAMSVAFCDMCSPYYEYRMLCCGIPAINVQGTVEDYYLLKSKWDELKKVFSSANLSSYFAQVSETLQSMLDNFSSSEFWQKMFHLERCGSGSDVELEGWITKFFKEIPSVRYIKNYTSGVSVMNYENLSTKKKYKMQEGLFFSRMDGDFLVPQFGFTIHEVQPEHSIKWKEEYV